MVELQLDRYLKSDDFVQGQDLKVVFTNEGVFEEQSFDGKPSVEVFVIGVKFGDQSRLWTMNKTSQRVVAGLLGFETKSWVGAHVSLFVADQNVSGKIRKVIYVRDKR